MRRKAFWTAAAVCLLAGGVATTVLADPDFDGTYDMKRYGGSWSDAAGESTLWLRDRGDGSFDIARREALEDGEAGPVLRGVATLGDDGWMRATIRSSSGLAGNLTGADTLEGRAVATVTNSGRVYLFYKGQDASGDQVSVFEYGDRGADQPFPGDDASDGDDADDTADDAADDAGDDTGDDGDDPGPLSDDLRIDSPVTGAFLAGQTVALEVTPADAEVSIEGPAERVEGGLRFTEAGTVTLKASQGDEESDPVELEVVTAQVTKLVVEPFADIVDADDVQFAKPLGAEEPTASEPVVLKKGEPMEVTMTLAASADLAHAATVTVSASDGDVSFEQEVELQALASGQEITLTSSGAPHEGVAISELELEWQVGEAAAGTTPLRVYTIHAAPRKNVDGSAYAQHLRDRTRAATERHFEKACFWARGRSENVGNGGDSIGYSIDNYMRHYVHWEDYDDGFVPAVPDYPEGAEPPINYDDLSGRWGNSLGRGERRVSSLYYPPLEPDEDYEKYTHYRNNYGWWVLDNPTHTGGRCNQQASLVCAILGTVGIKARVLYLERTGRGQQSGRPMRNYFYASGGGGPWNFHGVALADMDDGSQHIYDGSFSSPPRRKNGTREWAENEGGPFIQSFSDDDGEIWYYDGYGGRVPQSDIPTDDSIRGLPRLADDAND